MIKKVKNTVPWPYVIKDLNGEETITIFTKKISKRQIKKSLELKSNKDKSRIKILDHNHDNKYIIHYNLIS